MLAQLLEDKRKSTDKTSSRSPKANGKKEKAHLPYISRRRGNPISSLLNPHLKRKATSRMRVLILKE